MAGTVFACVCVSAVILFVNCYSVNLATGVQNVFTAAKLVAILIIICGGAYKLAEGEYTTTL
jgi:L-type amino acid transporter 9